MINSVNSNLSLDSSAHNIIWQGDYQGGKIQLDMAYPCKWADPTLQWLVIGYANINKVMASSYIINPV